VEIESAAEEAPRVLPDLKNATPACAYRAIDALAAVATDGSLLMSIVHRGTSGPIRLTVHVEDFAAKGAAQVRRLTADVPWAANTLEHPERVKPADESTEVKDGRLTLELNPFTVVRVRVPRG
jgi:alpha-N-arabinofuranosidase